ncbi:MAG: hypothetical protein ACRD5H_16650 [Nitrososphaerales archaeon]
MSEYQKAIDALADQLIHMEKLMRQIKQQAESEGIAPEELEQYIATHYPELPLELLHT